MVIRWNLEGGILLAFQRGYPVFGISRSRLRSTIVLGEKYLDLW